MAEENKPEPLSVNEIARLTKGTGLPLKAGTKWLGREFSPRRGIWDYERTLTFHRQLTQAELSALRKFLEADDCPGWTGVGGRELQEERFTYKFTTTYDSSD